MNVKTFMIAIHLDVRCETDLRNILKRTHRLVHAQVTLSSSSDTELRIAKSI